MNRQLLYRDLAKVSGLELLKEVPLAPLTSFRIGGPAGLFLRPHSIRALEKTLLFLSKNGLSYRILGQGTNLLINDQGEDIVLSLSALRKFELEWHNGYQTRREQQPVVTAESGCTLKSLLSWCVHHGFSGLEGLTGIPGSVGGALAMNAGTALCSIEDIVHSILVTGPDGSQWIRKNQLAFRYRELLLPEQTVIAAARFSLKKCTGGDIRKKIKEIISKRRSTQPLGKMSAGCIFKNPPDDSAGRVIDHCGIKGMMIGDAYVSRRHANFIINRKDAKASQVIELMEIIKSKVKEETGISLIPEVKIWRGHQ